MFPTFLYFGIFGLLGATKVDYSGYKLLSFPANADIARWLSQMELEEAVHFDEKTGSPRVLLDVFSEPSYKRKEAVVMVAPQFFDTFSALLKEQGVVDVRILKEDVQREIMKSNREMRKSRIKRDLDTASSFDLEKYHNYGEMVDYVHRICSEYSHIAQLIDIGQSFEGKRIYAVKVSTAGNGKPTVFIDAGIHAREWIAPATALWMIYELATKYGSDERITRAVDKFDWIILPQSNPDGYEYSMNVDRLWRKTRSKNTTVNKWCVGADANRNWGYRWGEIGTNRSPCSNIYAGAFPFSEPEIQAIKDFITWKIPQLTIYASFHSYGQVLLSPWGYTTQKPDNYLDQRNAAQFAVEAIRNTTGASYNHGTISELMYPASGTSIDFMQHLGVPYIYGIELRPVDGANSFAFSLPPTHIKPTGREMVSAFLALSEYATEHKKL